MKYKSLLVTTVCLAAFTVGGSSPGLAAPKAAPSPAAENAEATAAKPARPIAFHGKAGAVDKSAKTVTIAGKTHSRVLKITDKTVVTKMGNPAAFTDITENEEIRGSYWKHEDGTLEAKSLKFGGKTDAEKEADAARKAKRDAKKAAATEEKTEEEAEATPSPAPKKK